MSRTERPPLHESEAPDSTAGLAGFIRSAERRTVVEALAPARDAVPLEALLSGAADFAAKLTDAMRGESTLHERIACQAGCGWCCHVQVVVSAAEALGVADHLRRTLGPAELSAVHARLAALDQTTRGLSREQRADLRLPCALMVDFSCSVHPARPLRCRSWNSLDVERCKRELEHPRTGHLEIESVQWDVTRAVAAGLADGLSERGLDGARLEMTAAIRIALETPDAEARWRAGEAVFAAAAVK